MLFFNNNILYRPCLEMTLERMCVVLCFLQGAGQRYVLPAIAVLLLPAAIAKIVIHNWLLEWPFDLHATRRGEAAAIKHEVDSPCGSNIRGVGCWANGRLKFGPALIWVAKFFDSFQQQALNMYPKRNFNIRIPFTDLWCSELVINIIR